jgi:uncharacterized membrane protein YfcA
VSETLLALPFGVAIGVLLGLVGGGGSILAVPVLVYVLDQPVKEATTESLLVVGAAALVGAVDHARVGRLQTRTGLAFGAAGALGALAGTALNRAAADRALLIAFALLLLAAAGMLLRDPEPSAGAPRHSLVRVAAVGVGTGLLTGFLGVGGGFVIVPALVLLLGLPLSLAIGTSLLVIALTSATALAAHLTSGSIDWGIALVFAASAVAGVPAGRRLGDRIEPHRIAQLFGVLLVAVAVFLLARNLPAL